MKITEFKQQTTVIAKDQPEYKSLPAEVRKNDEGEIVSCWKPTFKERVKILFGANIFTVLLTFGGRIQPQRVTIGYPERSFVFWSGEDTNGNNVNETIVKESKLTEFQKEMLRKQNIDFHENL